MEPLEPRRLLAFGTSLLDDINEFGVSSLADVPPDLTFFPETMVEYNGGAMFVADDGKTGAELWFSDGTEGGTVQVADLAAGPEGSQPEGLTAVGGELFFTALDFEGDLDLWKTDGTTAGTVRVFDAEAAGVLYMSELTESGGKLFFTAYQEITSYELWVSDGTSSGTMLVKDINTDQDVLDGPKELTDVNGTLFFSSYTAGEANRELFKSDGTSAGTVLVKDIDGDSYESSNPSYLTNVNGMLFFAADTAADGIELYKSDGTDVGTVQVEDLHASGSSDPQSLTPFDNQLYFSANAGSGRQLYRSDGMTISLVADTTGVGDPSNPGNLTVVGSELFFAAQGGVVPGPVVAVSPTLNPSPNSNSRYDNSGSDAGWAGVIISVNGDDDGYQNEGRMRTATTSGHSFSTPSGGVGRIGAPGVGLSHIAVNDLYLRDNDDGELQVFAWDWELSDPAGLSDINFSGFISGNEFGRLQSDPSPEGVVFELFLNGNGTATLSGVVDGAALNDWAGTRDSGNLDALNLTHPGGAGITSAVVRMTLLGSGVNGGTESLVVGANLTGVGGSSGSADRELHKTDGTTTELVKNIVFVGPSNPTELTAVGNQLFFAAEDPLGSGRELWVSDGTEGGTQLVQDIRTGTDAYGAPLSGDPQQLTEVNGQLFFSARDNLNDRELWSSDGITTAQIKNINSGSLGSNIQQVTQVGNELFFVADNGIDGEAVYMTDLANDNILQVADVSASPSDRISGLTEFNGGVVFYHDSLGIFHTDGAVTTLISNRVPEVLDPDQTLFVEAGGELFFASADALVGEELYKITPGFVVSLVADLYSGIEGSQPRELIEFNNELYFSASELTMGNRLGAELYRYNGTQIVNLKDINLEPEGQSTVVTLGSEPRDLTVSAGRLYFTAVDGEGLMGGNHGRELWSTDGTTPGTTMVADLQVGLESSYPTDLTDVGGVLYFAADDGTNGIEPFTNEGTPSGAVLLANINSGGSDSSPDGFLAVGGTVYFAATESSSGRELWKSDGTTAGTMIVEDLQVGIDSSDPVALADGGFDRVLVSAIGSGTVDRELWVAGGSVSGLTLGKDINPGVFYGSHPRDIHQVGSDLLMVADDGFYGEELFQLFEAAPQAESVVISGGAVQRSTIRTISLTFDSEVEITGNPFAIQNTTANEMVDHSATIHNENGKTIVDFTFAPGAVVNSSGLLLDGEYVLTVDAAGVSSLGTLLDGDGDGTGGDNYVFGAQAADNFFRKFGDGDGSNFVDLSDFALFRAAYGGEPGETGYDEAFDDDGLDGVNLVDFSIFRRNYNS